MSFDASILLAGFKANGGWVDTELMGFKTFPGMGVGTFAIKDIPAHTPLFRISTHQILSPYTSTLRSLLSTNEWSSLGEGWLPLILVMMWESEKGLDSRWSYYLASLPDTFDSPMLWTDIERLELTGTDIENRIGRVDAEQAYTDKIIPLIKAHPDLFPSTSENFSLTSYHCHGSRILSRSFTIPRSAAGYTSSSTDSEGSFADEQEVAVLIPMADMLNATYGSDNARLFGPDEDDRDQRISTSDDEDGYVMITTTDISLGSQIFNTYSSPPNSELLRKYGHVDSIPLPSAVLELLKPEEIGSWPYGNPADEVEIAGSIITDAVLSAGLIASREVVDQRVEAWLDADHDDSFVIDFRAIDPEVVVFIRILSKDQEWRRFQKKGRLPMAVWDAQVADIMITAIALRKSRYRETLRDDLRIVTEGTGTSSRTLHSAIVRLGEKRVLAVAHRAVERHKHDSTYQEPPSAVKRKRVDADTFQS